jgi:hypothetical protein
MNESFDEHPRSRLAVRSMRERELEVQVAHLQAELEAANGGDDVAATSRFLAMAANTVDLAMEDARRDADDLAAEVSADAETRRDEATRLAVAAEARTDTLRTAAKDHEAAVIVAKEEAVRVKTEAEVVAKNLVSVERMKVADEIEALAEVRGALEEERGALESYHDELRRRVQELAESMVSFMTTEAPLSEAVMIDDFRPAPLGAPVDVSEPDAVPDSMTVWVAEPRPDRDEHAWDMDPITVDPIDFEQVVEFDIEPDPVGPDAEFDGIPVVEEVPVVNKTTGLFGAATEDEIEPRRKGESLFGSHGARLIEQASPAQLAAALEDDEKEDERFELFITGDVEIDSSREWLLRPERS